MLFREFNNKDLTSRAIFNGDFTVCDYQLLKSILKTALEASKSQRGIAVASTQVIPSTGGVDVPAAFLYQDRLYIDPVYDKVHAGQSRTIDSYETCLSDPLSVHMVKRYNKVLLTYKLIKGHSLQQYQRMFSGFEAIVVQHECDHLQGRPIWLYADDQDYRNKYAIK